MEESFPILLLFAVFRGLNEDDRYLLAIQDKLFKLFVWGKGTKKLKGFFFAFMYACVHRKITLGWEKKAS